MYIGNENHKWWLPHISCNNTSAGQSKDVLFYYSLVATHLLISFPISITILYILIKNKRTLKIYAYFFMLDKIKKIKVI